MSTYSRSELISLYQSAFGSASDLSEILALLSCNGLIDAESKKNGVFKGLFVTDLGIDFLRHPEQFVVEYGKVSRRATSKVDATSWTGKWLVLTHERVIADLRVKVSELCDLVHSMRIESNSVSQDLKGLVEALVSLCEMAAPDLGIIERILAHPQFRRSAGFVACGATIGGAVGI